MNMSRGCVRGFAVAAVAFVLCGCAHFPGGIAPSNTPIDGRKYKVIGPASATDSCVRLFCILPISGSNSTRAAVKAAIDSKQADALIDVTVESYTQFWILFSRQVTAVYGKAIMFEK
jgi:hypothetical protein